MIFEFVIVPLIKKSRLINLRGFSLSFPCPFRSGGDDEGGEI